MKNLEKTISVPFLDAITKKENNLKEQTHYKKIEKLKVRISTAIGFVVGCILYIPFHKIYIWLSSFFLECS